MLDEIIEHIGYIRHETGHKVSSRLKTRAPTFQAATSFPAEKVFAMAG
jgi:hypothetical protein